MSLPTATLAALAQGTEGTVTCCEVDEEACPGGSPLFECHDRYKFSVISSESSDGFGEGSDLE